MTVHSVKTTCQENHAYTVCIWSLTPTTMPFNLHVSTQAQGMWRRSVQFYGTAIDINCVKALRLVGHHTDDMFTAIL
jgi:hypothetical protein